MKKKTKVVVIGGGGHAKVVISILKKLKSFDIIGYTDNINKGELLKIPYLGTDEILAEMIKQGVNNAVIGVGQIKSAAIRIAIVEKLAGLGFIFPSIISPDSTINEDVFIDEGTVIMDGAVINTGTQVGKFAIINTKTSIDHDCKIGNFTHLAPGVTLSGGVYIGNKVLIGIGTSIKEGIQIVENCLIGGGSLVIKDLILPGQYVGIPAKRLEKQN